MDDFNLVSTLIGLIGGLGLFLYGMNLMGDGLENVAGDKLKNILEKVTSNPISAVIVGALVTMVIQSSSATTVMVVGFVNAGLMNLFQATGIIMVLTLVLQLQHSLLPLISIKLLLLPLV